MKIQIKRSFLVALLLAPSVSMVGADHHLRRRDTYEQGDDATRGLKKQKNKQDNKAKTSSNASFNRGGGNSGNRNGPPGADPRTFPAHWGGTPNTVGGDGAIQNNAITNYNDFSTTYPNAMGSQLPVQNPPRNPDGNRSGNRAWSKQGPGGLPSCAPNCVGHPVVAVSQQEPVPIENKVNGEIVKSTKVDGGDWTYNVHIVSGGNNPGSAIPSQGQVTTVPSTPSPQITTRVPDNAQDQTSNREQVPLSEKPDCSIDTWYIGQTHQYNSLCLTSAQCMSGVCAKQGRYTCVPYDVAATFSLQVAEDGLFKCGIEESVDNRVPDALPSQATKKPSYGSTTNPAASRCSCGEECQSGECWGSPGVNPVCTSWLELERGNLSTRGGGGMRGWAQRPYAC